MAFCGMGVINWPLLTMRTEYHGVNNSKHIIIRSFWEFTATLNYNESRRLLKLWTSSEVCPLSPPRLHIVSNGEGDRLPTAQSYAGYLLLPTYPNITTLMDKLE